MVKIVEVDFLNLKYYIDIGFDGDNDLIKYYDKFANATTKYDMVENTYDKLKGYYKHFKSLDNNENQLQPYIVKFNEKPIGFLFLANKANLLISFSINKNYRSKEILKSFFDCITNQFDKGFSCMLFKQNIRAIEWLKKCGMQTMACNNIYITLNY